jgi:hypothetical protein
MIYTIIKVIAIHVQESRTGCIVAFFFIVIQLYQAVTAIQLAELKFFGSFQRQKGVTSTKL